MEDCIFCKIMNGEIPTTKIYEDESCFAFLDIEPLAPTHFLVIPRKHVASAAEIDSETACVVGHIYEVIAKLAKEMGMEPAKIREIQKISQDPISIDKPVGEEEDSHLVDFISNDELAAPEEEVARILLKEDLIKALNSLTERERKVIELRFGLKDGIPMTLEQVGKKLGVTRERIRQIEAKAIRKLSRASSSKKLEGYTD